MKINFDFIEEKFVASDLIFEYTPSQEKILDIITNHYLVKGSLNSKPSSMFFVDHVLERGY